MLIVLPPSEGKTAPTRGPRLDFRALSATQLTGARQAVLGALIHASARPDALTLLGVGAGKAADVARNTRLPEEHTAAAARVYTGVLFEAAGLAGLRGAAAERAERDVRIVSALWGVLSPADRIPAYRLSMGVELPGIGRLAAYWRSRLSAELDGRAAGEVVVDCRSAAYTAAWKPPAGAEHVTVNVVRESGGRRQVVSHHAKHTRGLLTQHLLRRRGRTPRSADELAAAATRMPPEQVRAVELAPAGRPGSARALTLVI